MSRFFLTLLTAALATAAAPAQAEETVPPAVPSSLTATVTPSYVSAYMFRGIRISGAAFEPSVEADTGNWALGLWGNFPLASRVPGQANTEIDPYVFYTCPLNTRLALVSGIEAYVYPRAEFGAGAYRSTVEPNLALNATWQGFRLQPKAYYDLTARVPTMELNAASAVPLTTLGTELDFTATVGSRIGARTLTTGANGLPGDRAWGNYWLAGVALPFQLSAGLKLTVGYAYTRGSDVRLKAGALPPMANPAAVGRGVLSVALAYTF